MLVVMRSGHDFTSTLTSRLDDAERHGELRLGTLSGGTNDGKYRPTAKEVFAHLVPEE